MSRTVIVACYDEDVDWTNHLPAGWDVLIVQKGEQVPNEGREALSYMWAFENHDWADDDQLVCVQGAPFVHSPRLIYNLYFGDFACYTPISEWEVTCDGEGKPHHPGLPVKEKYEEWFGKKWPGSVTFHSGAQFAVTGQDVKRDWSQWIERSKEEHGPWLIERFWQEIFDEAVL